VPEDAVVTLDLPVVAAARPADAEVGAAHRQDPGRAAQVGGLTAVFELRRQGAEAGRHRRPLKGADLAGAYFFPIPARSSTTPPQTIERGPEGLTLG
jgi:DsbC/DsbD-like thiol-disulfide interchange protein